METVIESSVPIAAILHIALVVKTMDKKTFENEALFQMTLHLARKMLASRLISEKEYRAFEQEMLREYQPFSGDLYTC